jgi:AraC family transcriptional regulator
LDESKVSDQHTHAGAVVVQRELSGAHVSRIMHPPDQRIEAHGHDWPTLILCRLGGYHETADHGVGELDGPGIVFQPAKFDHADEIGARGLETLTLTFDPAWIGAARAALPDRIVWIPTGPAIAAMRTLADVWDDAHCSDDDVRAATARFVLETFARDASAPPPPAWRDDVAAMIEHGASSARTMAQSLALHPAWLARAYRAWRGEGIAETARRRRVERASLLLRQSAAGLADVAADAGFCDQSHMNRAFRAVLGRTPLEVRREASIVNSLAAAG